MSPPVSLEAGHRYPFTQSSGSGGEAGGGCNELPIIREEATLAAPFSGSDVLADLANCKLYVD